MTNTLQQRSDFYVYALFREDGVTPFYIGMGCRDRWLQHERTAYRRQSHKDFIILKMRRQGIGPVPKSKISDGLTRAQAIQLERDMIALVGRYPNGPLSNKTSGGEGLFNPDEETREKMREARKHYVCSAETKAKLSAAGMGRIIGPPSEETRAKLSASVRGFKHTEAAKAKISQRSKRQKLTPAGIEKLRQSRLGVPMADHVKAALVAANTGRKKTAEEIDKRRMAMANFKHSAEAIDRMKAVQSNRSRETRARISAAAKAGWVKRRNQNALPSQKDTLSNPHQPPSDVPTP